MTISKRTLDTLIDLVEIKLSCVEVYDRDDARELANLEHCLDELLAMAGRTRHAPEPAMDFAPRAKGRAHPAA